MKISIYTVTHKAFHVPENPIYIPIHAGHKVAKEDFGYLGDDTGEQISDKNCFYGELTALYWIWKNDRDSDYLGMCHYRRFFIDDKLHILNEKQYMDYFRENDVMAAQIGSPDKSFEDLYEEAHYIKDLKIIEDVIREQYPQDLEVFQKVVYGNTIYVGNLFAAPRELFMEYCQWLFSILFEAEKRIDVTGYDLYHKRVYGFLAEQLLGVWIQKKQLKIGTCRFGVIQEKAETIEVKQKLQEFVNQEEYKKAIDYFEDMLQKRPDILLQASDLEGNLQEMYNTILICQQEKENEVQGLIHYTHELPELVQYKKRIQECLYKVVHNVSSQCELGFLSEKNISWVADIAVILNTPEWNNSRVEVLNQVAMIFFASGVYDKVIPFLYYAFSMDESDEMTRANMKKVLMEFGEEELADTF